MRYLFFAALALTIGCSSSMAQGGAVPIRVNDGEDSRCINGMTDQIWFTLRRVITTKHKGWFTKDESVAGILKASVKTNPQLPQPIEFPLYTEATFGDAGAGQVSVPLEYTIVSGLNLLQGSVMYTGLGIEMTLINRKGKNTWGSALSALSEIAKKLPIPASPITQSASYLMDFANTAVTKDIEGQDINDKVKSASLALNFDPSGLCGGSAPDGSDFESTGTIAVLHEDGIEGDGYVDIGRTNEYCWSAELRPAFVLKAVRKEAGAPCSDARYAPKYRQVTNNYVGFFLNAIRGTGVSGVAAEDDIEQSIGRCLANGLDRSVCLD